MTESALRKKGETLFVTKLSLERRGLASQADRLSSFLCLRNSALLVGNT